MPNDSDKTDPTTPVSSNTVDPAVVNTPPQTSGATTNSDAAPAPPVTSLNINDNPNPIANVTTDPFTSSPTASIASEAPAPVEPETVVTSPQTPKKYGGKKIIATIFGVLVLMAGVAVAVFLVQRQQDLRQKASSGAECTHSPDCVLLEDPGNSGSYTAPRNINKLFITARTAIEFNPNYLDNQCYRVTIDGSNLQWQRYGDGPDCKDISNIQIWLGNTQPSPTTPPGPQISASCGSVKAYNSTWNQLTSSELNALKAGNTVRFAVSGTTSSGNFDRAKFIINGTETETTTLRPGTDEFYIEYTIPNAVTNFTVNAQIHHTSLGWF